MVVCRVMNRVKSPLSARVNGGSSLIDYVLASPDAMPLIQSLQVLPAPETDHMAVHLRIARSTAASAVQQRRRPRRRPAAPPPPAAPEPPRLRTEAQMAAWQEHLRQPGPVMELYLMEVKGGTAQTPEDIHAAGLEFDAFVERTQAEVLAAQPAAKGRRRGAEEQPPWWDKELADGRRAARQAMRSDARSHAARAARADYQRALRRKLSRWTRSQAIALVTSGPVQPGALLGQIQSCQKACLLCA